MNCSRNKNGESIQNIAITGRYGSHPWLLGVSSNRTHQSVSFEFSPARFGDKCPKTVSPNFESLARLIAAIFLRGGLPFWVREKLGQSFRPTGPIFLPRYSIPLPSSRGSVKCVGIRVRIKIFHITKVKSESCASRLTAGDRKTSPACA